MDTEKLKKKYFASREELDVIRSNMTLLKWEVLSKTYKMGKEIWGQKFSVKQLASDMGLPLTTAKRCLSLDKATKKSWELMRDGKISAFKLAMVCQLKDNTFQDEIVEEVVKKKLSTCQIKTFRPKSLDDIKKWKHKKAVEEGYARKDTAYRAIKNWIARGMTFTVLPISSVGDKREEVISELRKLKTKLDRYLEKYG